MKTDFNVSLLNSTGAALTKNESNQTMFNNVMNIYVQPHDDWHLSAEEF